MAAQLDLGGDPIEIATYGELTNFLANERQRWTWLRNAAPNNVYNFVMQQFTDLVGQVERRGHNNQLVIQAVRDVASAFAGGIVYSGSEKGTRILEVMQQYGDVAGGAAYGLITGTSSLTDMRSIDHFRGVAAVAFPALTPVDATLASLRQERTNLRTALTDVKRRAALAAKEQERRARSAWWSAARTFVKSQASRRETFSSLAEKERARFSEFEQTFADAIGSFQATEEAYKEQMELQAPVTYWEKKAADHKAQERLLLRFVVAYFALTIPTVIALFGLAGGWLLGIPAGGGKVESAMYVVVGAGLAAVTTLVLWAGRLLTRFYLSQNHLHHDANDRAVMTRTFLALTSVRQADEKDRAIILAALFRPTADGIVKDDGAPDLGVAGVASKILGGKP